MENKKKQPEKIVIKRSDNRLKTRMKEIVNHFEGYCKEKIRWLNRSAERETPVQRKYC